MASSKKRYNLFVISWLIVLFLFLLFFGSFGLIKEIKGNNPITSLAVSDSNQTQPHEVYSIKSYTIFYFGVIFLALIVAIISLILIFPRIKKYT